MSNVDPYENIPVMDAVPVVDAAPQPMVETLQPNGGAGSPAPASAAANLPTVNEDDLYGAPDEVSETASVADMPPPIDDGWYLYKARMSGNAKAPTHKDPRSGKTLPGGLISGTQKDGTKTTNFRFWIELEAIDGGGRKAGAKVLLFADTFLRGPKDNQTTWADDVIKAATGRGLGKRNLGQLRDALIDCLKKEPIIGVRHEWQAKLENRRAADNSYLKDSEVIVRRGQDSFPQGPAGGRVPLTVVPSGPHKDEPCKTQSEIVQVAHRSQVPARGSAQSQPGQSAQGAQGTGSTPTGGVILG